MSGLGPAIGCRLCVCWLALCVRLFHAAPLPVPDRVNCSGVQDGQQFLWFLDRVGNQSRQEFQAAQLNFTLLEIEILTDDALTINISGVCRQPDGYSYSDPLAWVPYVKPAGQAMVADILCDIFQLNITTTPMAFLTVAVDAAHPGTWVGTNTKAQTLDPYGSGEYVWANSSRVFTSWQPVDSLPQELFYQDPECHSGGIICPEGGAAIPYKAYRFHEPHWDGILADQDIGDLLGDAFYVCANVLGAGLPPADYQWVSVWDLTLNNSWAQYAFCNFDPPLCLGGSKTLVGREAAFGYGPGAGQCTPNRVVGDWLSLPKAGECMGSQKVGDQGCSWKNERRIKTIDGQCLFKRDFKAACEADMGPPFTKAAAVFEAAFADEAAGGCPALIPPSVQQLSRPGKSVPSLSLFPSPRFPLIDLSGLYV